MVISHMQYFLQRSFYHTMVAASFPVALVAVTPYSLSLKVPWVNK
jgi:hypothetical protein